MNKVHLYDKILAPIVTEKSTNLSEQNKIIFKVPFKANKKMKLLDLQQRYIPKKALVMQDMLVKKHLYLLEVVLHMVQKEKATIRLEN